MTTNSIIHTNVLKAGNTYPSVKTRVQEMLRPWSDMFECDDALKEIRYKTEGPLLPEDNGKEPVLILLSNPHPHSVKQGMFLSPNRMGKENPFWETMRSSGYFRQNGSAGAVGMIPNHYESPFRFFMHVLLPFPSEDPGHLKDILGHHEYWKMMADGKESIKDLIEEHNIKGVICFGKLQYDALSHSISPQRYTSALNQGKIIQDSSYFSDNVRICLTYPTGWRFVKDFRRKKANNLRRIFETILQ